MTRTNNEWATHSLLNLTGTTFGQDPDSLSLE
jgi:hypothetical protein